MFRTCHSTWMETHATGLLAGEALRQEVVPDHAGLRVRTRARRPASRTCSRKIGGTIVGNELTPLGTTDFSSYLTKIDAAKPDLVLVLVQGDDYTNCLKQMNQFGLLKKYPVGGPQVELEPLLGPAARKRAEATGASNGTTRAI